MSATESNGPASGLVRLPSGWGWFAALGIGLIILGVIVLLDIVVATLVSIVFIGAMLTVGGVFQAVHALLTRGQGGFFINLLAGVLYILCGVLMMAEPVQGAFVLTLFIVAGMIAAGALRVVVGLQSRRVSGGWLLAISGVVSMVLGVLLVSWLPWSSMVVPGALIGIELVVHGASWLRFGLALRRHGA